jgi:hypothetical protein
MHADVQDMHVVIQTRYVLEDVQSLLVFAGLDQVQTVVCVQKAEKVV